MNLRLQLQSCSLQPALVQGQFQAWIPQTRKSGSKGGLGDPAGSKGGKAEGSWSPAECLQPLPAPISPLSPATSTANTDPLPRTTAIGIFCFPLNIFSNKYRRKQDRHKQQRQNKKCSQGGALRKQHQIYYFFKKKIKYYLQKYISQGNVWGLFFSVLYILSSEHFLGGSGFHTRAKNNLKLIKSELWGRGGDVNSRVLTAAQTRGWTPKTGGKLSTVRVLLRLLPMGSCSSHISPCPGKGPAWLSSAGKFFGYL